MYNSQRNKDSPARQRLLSLTSKHHRGYCSVCFRFQEDQGLLRPRRGVRRSDCGGLSCAVRSWSCAAVCCIPLRTAHPNIPLRKSLCLLRVPCPGGPPAPLRNYCLQPNLFVRAALACCTRVAKSLLRSRATTRSPVWNRRDGARHSNHANSTECDDVTGTLCVCLCVRVCGGVLYPLFLSCLALRRAECCMVCIVLYWVDLDSIVL